MVFSSRAGYEFSYNFSLLRDVIFENPSEAVVFFEFRTFFLLLRNSSECEALDAEKGMSVILPVPLDEGDDPFAYFDHVSYRLDQYLMSEDEIKTLIQRALDFARQVTAPAAIAIDIDVCTVVLDDETVDEALHRSVRPDCLVPLDLIRPDVAAAKEDESYLLLRKYLLFELPRIRVEDLHVDGFGPLMDTCPICSSGPTAAAPVSLLPCMHAFHTHCIVRWLLESESCPMCLHSAAEREGGRVKSEELDWPVKEEQLVEPMKEEQLVGPVTQAQSTVHLPGPTRVRRAPAWHRDYVVGGGVRVGVRG